MLLAGGFFVLAVALALWPLEHRRVRVDPHAQAYGDVVHFTADLRDDAGGQP